MFSRALKALPIAALWAAFLLSGIAVAQDTPSPSLSGANKWRGQNTEAYCPVADGTTIAISMTRCVADGTKSPDAYSVTLTGSLHKFVNPPVVANGQTIRFRIVEGGSGGYSPEWDTDYGFGSGGAWPDLSSVPAGEAVIVICNSNAAGTLDCVQAMSNVAVFTPATAFPDLVAWLDPSDHTTTYASANCTGALVSTSGTAILSIKDKSNSGFCFNATGTVTLTASGSVWWLAFNGSSYLTAATGSGTNPNTLADGVTNLLSTIGAFYPSDTANQALFWISINSGTTTARYAAGFDINGSTGQGPGMLLRAPDSGTAGALNQGSTAGFLSTPLAQHDNAVLTSGNGSPNNAIYQTLNNNQFVDTFNAVADAATDATLNGAVYVGYNGTTAVVANTRLYQLIVREPSVAPGFSQNQTQWFVCTKMGTAC